MRTLAVLEGLRSWGMAALLVAAVSGSAAAQQPYPSQDIHVINGYPAGSGSDVIVRYFTEKLRRLAGRAIIVENKPGANGSIATEYVARARPDGYVTLLHAGGGIAGNMHLFKKPPVDAGKALQMVATLNLQAFMLTVASNSPYKTAAELTAAMKAKGDKATYATSSTASRTAGGVYKYYAGLSAVEVQYRQGNDTLNDMASGAIDFAFHDPVLALSQMREGKLRVLGLASQRRLEAAQGIPTLAEQGFPKIDLTGWFAVSVPAATPRPIVDQLNAWYNQILAMPETREFLYKAGGDPFISTPDEAQAYFLAQIEAQGEAIRAAKIEPQ